MSKVYVHISDKDIEKDLKTSKAALKCLSEQLGEGYEVKIADDKNNISIFVKTSDIAAYCIKEKDLQNTPLAGSNLLTQHHGNVDKVYDEMKEMAKDIIIEKLNLKDPDHLNKDGMTTQLIFRLNTGGLDRVNAILRGNPVAQFSIVVQNQETLTELSKKNNYQNQNQNLNNNNIDDKKSFSQSLESKAKNIKGKFTKLLKKQDHENKDKGPSI